MEDDEVAAEKIMAKAIVADDIVVLMNIMILLGRLVGRFVAKLQSSENENFDPGPAGHAGAADTSV
eukprot:scaffold4211_cov102-Skeletonema_marinoi.AAC.1